jgi:hypothetical protein
MINKACDSYMHFYQCTWELFAPKNNYKFNRLDYKKFIQLYLKLKLITYIPFFLTTLQANLLVFHVTYFQCSAIKAYKGKYIYKEKIIIKKKKKKKKKIESVLTFLTVVNRRNKRRSKEWNCESVNPYNYSPFLLFSCDKWESGKHESKGNYFNLL